jgi:hypothetical protein
LAARIAVVLVGVWLLFAPAVLDYTGTTAADNDRIIGPIAGSFAFVACWAVLDPLRWPTAPLGAWLVVAPLLLGYDNGWATVSSVASGLLVAGLAVVGGGRSHRFGGGWSTVFPTRWDRGHGASSG